MGWGFVWLMLILKIPIALLLWLVWWAVKQAPDEERQPQGGGGSPVRQPRQPRQPRHPRRPLPRHPRRGPHGEPAPPAPARMRSVVARARTAER
jgi:hypothetical protein